MIDLHRHDEFSTFDGFGKAIDLAKLAKELGHTAFSTTNHGNTNGLVKHYKACKEVGIKCILGVEGYFQPKFNKEQKRTHLCLFVKNLQGYENLNNIMYIAEQQKYYNPIITFKELKKYSEGLICSTACVAGYLAQCILKDRFDRAEKFITEMQSIFGDDFYIELQPYETSEKAMQDKVNFYAVQLADKFGVKCILTSDSHYGSKDDFDTYLKMHEIAKHDIEQVKVTYSERYMPTEEQIKKRFIDMHKNNAYGFTIENAENRADEFVKNIDEIENKIEQNILDELKQELPKIHENSFEIVKQKVKQGLKRIGKSKDKSYIERVKNELHVINVNKLADYFLIVADYVKWAREKGIMVGYGRGSCCNCEVAYLMEITDVDSIKYNLNFQRFLREDKKKLPDIDIDFETDRRQEVIDYLISKYKGKSAQICSYGLYKVDNLLNDLSKVCGLDDDADKKTLKKLINSHIDDNLAFYYNRIDFAQFDRKYDNIVKHFSKLYNQVRYIGTHAAGVAICGESLLKHCGIRIQKDKETGVQREYTCYDLSDLEDVQVIKFDMLGLKTMQELGELRKATGCKGLTDEVFEDKEIFERFRTGDTDGIFQYESNTPKEILRQVDADCFEDIVAVSSMNRPAPLSMKMPDLYAHNKFHIDEVKNTKFYKYTKESYGVVVYQEQLQMICVEIGGLSWDDADKLMKLMKRALGSDAEKVIKTQEEIRVKFVAGAMKNGLTNEEANETYDGMLKYLFNKGHAVGYALISLEEMFYKVHYPTEFWCNKMRFCPQADEAKKELYESKAVRDGAIILTPHVNYSDVETKLKVIDGDRVIVKGLCDLKNCGAKASVLIANERANNGIFKSYDDFYDRCKNRAVTSRVIDVLKEQGALDFNKKSYLKHVKQYNTGLYLKANNF